MPSAASAVLARQRLGPEQPLSHPREGALGRTAASCLQPRNRSAARRLRTPPFDALGPPLQYSCCAHALMARGPRFRGHRTAPGYCKHIYWRAPATGYTPPPSPSVLPPTSRAPAFGLAVGSARSIWLQTARTLGTRIEARHEQDRRVGFAQIRRQHGTPPGDGQGDVSASH